MSLASPSDRLNDLLHTLQHISAQTIVMGLERVEALCARLGHPEKRLPPVIHIAGTNGKGSTSAFLHALANAAGLTVHRYTSPHLVRFHERIVVADREISDAQLIRCLEAVQGPAQELGATYFESTTVAAYLAFAETPADLAILETGMGGRLDATNVVTPILTAITPISYDHQAFLGATLEAIAGEKAGIIKPGVPCVVGPQRDAALAVLRQRAAECGSRLYVTPQHWRVEPEAQGFSYISDDCWLDGLAPSLPGEHQYSNAGIALACFELLQDRWCLSGDEIRDGISGAVWPARLQKLEGTVWNAALPEGVSVWLDGGHNEGAGSILRQWMIRQRRPVHVICGMLADKDHAAFLAKFEDVAASLQCLTIPDTPQSASAEVLLSAAQKSGLRAEKAETLAIAIQALCKTHAAPYDILICGSLYLAGYVLGECERKLT
jgi:dihydrofolate synthase/folylpolyglutamate synthase